jgi:hypothetical protein
MTVADPGNRPPFRFAALALGLALLGAGSMLYYHLGLFIPRMLQIRAMNGGGNGYSFGDDFYPIWLAARQRRVEHRDLYGPEMTRQIQIGLFGRALDPRNPADPPTDYRQFAYPAFAELLLWPAALLEFPTLRLVLAVLLPVLTAASIWLWLLALQWRVPALQFVVLVLLMLCTYELLEASFAEQPGLLVWFFLGGAALALRRNRLMLAGALMSLTLIKPQMTLLALAYLLLWSFVDRRRARFWLGFLVATTCLITASLWIWPRWVEQWLRILLGYHRYAMPPLVNVLLGPKLGAYLGPVVIVAFLAVSAAAAWRNRRVAPDSMTFWWTLSLLLAITSVTLLPGQAIYDQVILIPGILLLLRYWRELRDAGRVSRSLLLAGGLVLFWPWMAAFALLVVRSWIAPEVFYSPPVFSLPIRTAASLPFAVLAPLAYAMRVKALQNRVVGQ